MRREVAFNVAAFAVAPIFVDSGCGGSGTPEAPAVTADHVGTSTSSYFGRPTQLAATWAVCDPKGKNLAPGEARQIEVDARSGRVTSIR